MKYNKSQSGFSIIEIIVGVAVLAVGITVGIVGMNAYNSQNKAAPTAEIKTPASQNTVDDVPTAPVVNTVESLDDATATIDSINIDEDNGDSAKLESQTADF